MSLEHTSQLTELARQRPTWLDPESIPSDVDLHRLHQNTLMAQLLYRRGLRTSDDAARFLGTESAPFPAANAVPNLNVALLRIAEAIDAREHIGVFGDYDVDGITSTAMLTTALRNAISADHVLPVLPERSNGYGLHKSGVDRIADFGASLLITVDCGSSDIEQVAYAQSRGLDVVIVDHHQMQGTGPANAITANPQLNGSTDIRSLTAAGLTFLLIMSLAKIGYSVTSEQSNPLSYLDLAALGTVADVAPLLGTNRDLVRQGIDVLRSTRRPGISALISEARLSQKGIEASHIAFQLAPRINAAGRLANANLALDLLLSDSPREALKLAADLNQLNLDRRGRQDLALSDACQQILAMRNWQQLGFIAVANPNWEAGLVGVVAGRLCDMLRRPVVVLRDEGDVLHGSARSVPGFDIGDAFQQLSNLLERHGGHGQAAGLAVQRANFDTFTEEMNNLVAASGIPIPSPKTIQIDADVDESHIRQETVRSLSQLQPFGHGNPEPVLRIRGARLWKYTDLSNGKHLKLFVGVGSHRFEAILWNGGWRSRELVMQSHVDLAGHLDLNEFNGTTRLQMILEDFRLV